MVTMISIINMTSFQMVLIFEPTWTQPSTNLQCPSRMKPNTISKPTSPLTNPTHLIPTSTPSMVIGSRSLTFPIIIFVSPLPMALIALQSRPMSQNSYSKIIHIVCNIIMGHKY